MRSTFACGVAMASIGPSSILVTEAFLIENGKIRHVEMIGPGALYHINSPWGRLSGN